MSQRSSDFDDLNIEPNEEEDDAITPLKYSIHVIPADYTLELLYHKWRCNEIVIPSFQRSYVWNINQASKLIDSFMMGLPIPPIYFHISNDEKNTVIDGRQRLQTIFYFFDGFFGEADHKGKRKEFKLVGINKTSPWFDKRFDDFTEADKRLLKNFVLRTILVKQVDPKHDHSSVYYIFERLNTGGTPLNDQEIRNCVCSGTLNVLLVELNRYASWRHILGKQKLDSRQRDIQLILRYMSLFHDSQEYKRPMKDFLTNFMNKNRNPSKDFLHEEEHRFKQTCDLIIDCLGQRPFNPKGALNPSTFDAIFVAFAKNFDSIPSDISKRVELLRDDDEFKKLTSKATTDPSTVLKRLKLTEIRLFK